MRTSLLIVITLVIASSVAANDLLSPTRPDKPAGDYAVNVPGDRQGGDTIAAAVSIVLPYSGAGTTAGYNDDYDEVCPYTGSTSPDVVYTVTPAADGTWNIDLFGSTYDTKLYVYDENLNLVACNDDFYSDYVSKLEIVPLMGGVQYFIVIDGYGGEFGDYVINVVTWVECVLECPAGAELEGEPPLVSGYLDAHNGGCSAHEFGIPFSAITAGVYCGVSGLYDSSRDTDWFEVVVPASGLFEVVCDAELATFFFELGPTNCDEVSVIQDITAGPCVEATMVIPGAPGSTIWFFAAPTTFGDGTVFEYDYVLYTNLVVATEDHSWSEVKALFD